MTNFQQQLDELFELQQAAELEVQYFLSNN
jgi:hypothetical protein